jgi:hypothetical protein
MLVYQRSIWLVVSNMTFIFPLIYWRILPIDELIFFKMLMMVIAPPTRIVGCPIDYG